MPNDLLQSHPPRNLLAPQANTQQFTLEQQRALALARARQRSAQSEQGGLNSDDLIPQNGGGANALSFDDLIPHTPSIPSGHIEVEMPDGTIVEFPEGTRREVMENALRQHFPPQQAETARKELLRRRAKEELERRHAERGRTTSGPWERYQSQSPEQGPWTRYQTPQPQERQPRDLFADPQSTVSPPSSHALQATSGVNEGLANLIGAPVDIANLAVGAGIRGFNAVAGTDFEPSQKPFLGSEHIKGLLESAGTIAPESDQASHQFTRRIGQEVGASLIPGAGAVAKSARPIKAGTALLASAAGSGAGAGVAQQVAPNSALAEFAGQAVGGFTPLAAANTLRRKGAMKALEDAVPSMKDLKRQTNAAFDAAEKAGVPSSPNLVSDLSRKFDNTLDAEGILIDNDLAIGFPKIHNARKQLAKYTDAEVTIPRLKAIRKSLQKAAGSKDGSERFIGTSALRDFDEAVDPLSPQFKEARLLHQRRKKAEQLQELTDLARAKAKRTGTVDSQLRGQFGRLSEDIIKGKQSGFSTNEIAAIDRVVDGTRMGNAASAVSKFAPTGVLSTATTGGLPGLAAGAAGGPLAGGLAAATASGASLAARPLANKITNRHAELAQLLVQNGGPLDNSVLNSPTMQRLRQSLLIAQGANQLNE